MKPARVPRLSVKALLARYSGVRVIWWGGRIVPVASKRGRAVRVEFAHHGSLEVATCVLDVPTLDELRLLLEVIRWAVPHQSNEGLALDLARASLDAGYRRPETVIEGRPLQRQRLRQAREVLDGIAKVAPGDSMRACRQTLVRLVEQEAELHAEWVKSGRITEEASALDVAAYNVMNTFWSRYPDQWLPPWDKVRAAVVACLAALKPGRPKKTVGSARRQPKWAALAALFVDSDLETGAEDLRVEAGAYRRGREPRK